MNAQRRKMIETLIAGLEPLKQVVEDLAIMEEEAFENMPEGLQASERGEAAERASEALTDANGSFEDVLSALNTALEA